VAKPKLEISNLSITYHTVNGETEAIRNFSLAVNEGELISIVGPSGCGKSTLLSVISGLLKPSSGKVYLDGQELVGTSNYTGYMFQKDNLFEWRTIQQNVMIGLEIQHKVTPELRKKLENMLLKYGLGNFKNYYPRQLSGGMRQRVALIRTLVTDPVLLLLDEPFSALDYQTRLAVADEVSTILKQEQKTAIFVTHDISEAISMADRVVVLSSRPAVIKNIYDIKFSCDTRTPLKCREAPEFRYYFNSIWKELDVHVG
jgi:NitT/TauT family transport system ATP-binding protein